MDVKVPVNRLNKASAPWWKIDCNNTWPPSTFSNAETMNALTSAFAVVFPECVAVKSNDRWYSAGHRVRGAALKNAADEDAVILWEAKPSRWKKERDHSVAHLQPLFCVPCDPKLYSNTENVVAIGDSTLQLAGVMYGIACVLRKLGCNLLWFVSKSGAGAQELKQAWEDAPPYHWGLTVTRNHKRRLDSFVRVCSGSRR